MKFTEVNTGRIFVIRLEDGEIIHESIERFAINNNIKCASLFILGGVDAGSKLIVGPREGRTDKIVPLELELSDVHEITGSGTIFPDKNGEPVLHMHIACGRMNSTITGCIRRGVKTWHVLEIILTELLNCNSARLPDSATGFELLVP